MQANIFKSIQTKYSGLPEDVQMGLISFVAVPLLLAIVVLAHVTSPIALTPEMLPGAFYNDGTIKVALLFELFAILSAIFIGLMRGGHGGSMGFMIGAFLQAGIVHLFN